MRGGCEGLRPWEQGLLQSGRRRFLKRRWRGRIPLAARLISWRRLYFVIVEPARDHTDSEMLVPDRTPVQSIAVPPRALDYDA